MHPKNKHERKEVGKYKGQKRALWTHQTKPSSWSEREWQDWVNKQVSLHRDTTKTCGKDCCKNPRRNPWSKNKDKYTLQELREFEKDYPY